MKLFNQRQLLEWDRYTIEKDGMNSLELIEEAGQLLAEEMEDQFTHNHQGPVRIFCGLGNNGADGLVVARKLGEYVEDLEVIVIQYKEKGSSEFEFYLQATESCGIPISYVSHKDQLEDVPAASILVDAIFGTGVNRPLQGLTADVVLHLNRQEVDKRIAIDQPSGLHPDRIMDGPVFKADYTLSIASRKLSTFFREHEDMVGEVVMIPLQLSAEYYEKTATTNHVIDLMELFLASPQISTHAFKNEFGHVLFVGGSLGKMGAALLASEAALRAGCGLVTAHIPSSGVDILQIGLPEAMVSVDEHPHHISHIPDLSAYQTICIGCGLGKDVSPILLSTLLARKDIPKVIDADALNLLAEHPILFKDLNDRCILTPHIGEFHRLFGACDTSEVRFNKLIEKSKELNCYIILKGRYTMIATPEGHCFFNITGNPVLGTAGSGDVLAGYIAGHLARGFPVLEACKRAVCFHGYAGDLLLLENGQRGSLARDILQKLARIEVESEDLLGSVFSVDEDEDILGLDLLDNPN